MKSQNVLEQKQSKSKKIHSKTNNKNFCPKKKNLIHKKKRKASMWWNEAILVHKTRNTVSQKSREANGVSSENKQ